MPYARCSARSPAAPTTSCPSTPAAVAEAVALIGRYEQLRIGLADASVAVVAAAARTPRPLTLDERHFRPMRPLWGETFQLLSADAA